MESILNTAYAPEKLRPAHRIDAMTTGLVVLARRFAFASQLQPQFSQGQVEKTYLAWVSGDPAWDEQSCDLSIGNTPLPHGRRALDPQGLPASTTFRVRARHGDRALLEAIPHTGRTHQLRLHLAALGHPILGDPLYAARTTDTPAPEAVMMLHAWRLAFRHPADGRPVEFEAPLPASWPGPNSEGT